jgi:hypothetical protein
VSADVCTRKRADRDHSRSAPRTYERAVASDSWNWRPHRKDGAKSLQSPANAGFDEIGLRHNGSPVPPRQAQTLFTNRKSVRSSLRDREFNWNGPGCILARVAAPLNKASQIMVVILCSSRESSPVFCAAALALAHSDIPHCRGFPGPVRCKSTVDACCENDEESESAQPPRRSESAPASTTLPVVPVGNLMAAP